ncbi:MAG: hypothetical protein V2B19_01470 [Pseudomonadota bacterium]
MVTDTFKSKPVALIQTGPFPQERMERANPKVFGQKDFFEVKTARLLKKADSIFRTARAYQTRAEHIARSGKAEKPISHDKSS